MSGHVVLLTGGYPPARQTIPRTAAFAKYLRQAGWAVTVVTPRVPPGARGPFFEAPVGVDVRRPLTLPTVATLVAAAVRLVRPPRRRGLREGFAGGEAQKVSLLRDLLKWTEIPDQLVGWIPAAASAAGRVARAIRPSVVCASGPPFSVVLAGATAAWLAGAPLIADFRDTWCLDESDPFGTIGGRFRARPSRTRLRVLRSLERWCLKRADAVMFTSEKTQAGYEETFPFLDSRTTIVLNGADPEDFVDDPGPVQTAIIAHVGSVHEYQAEQFRALLDALAFMRSRGQLAGLRLVQAGAIGLALRSQITAQIEKRFLGDVVDVRGFLPHREAVRLMRTSRLLVLLAGRNHFVRLSKISECVAAGRPLLALAEDQSETAVAARAFGARTIGDWSPANVATGILEILKASEAPLKERSAAVLRHPHPLNRITAAHQLGQIAERLVRRGRCTERLSGGGDNRRRG